MAIDFFVPASDEHMRREKAKAREIRSSPWWKRRRSTGMCFYCGRKYRAIELTMDHIIPLARGGKSIHANIVPACKDCNNKKKYLLPIEWEEYLDTLKKGSPS